MKLSERLWSGGCEETRERLSGYIEDDLARRQRRRVLRHLARCAHCRALLDSLSRTIEHLRSLARSELSPEPSLADAVVDRICREGGERTTP